MLKLSVIIPVYNVEDYLRKCLDSVIIPEVKTESKQYEIIIVDDGSTDSSPEIADRYAAMYPQLVRVIHKENGGLGDARNVGIKNSDAEYLYFLDSDDYLVDGSIEAMLESLAFGYDICIFDTIAVNIEGKELKYMHGCSRSENLSLKYFPELLLESPHAWNKIYRRTLYTEHDIFYPSRVWFEDLATVLKLYCFAEHIVYIPQAFHRYLQRKGSILNSGNTARNAEIIPAVDEILGFYKKQGRFEELADCLEYMVFYHQFLTASVRVCLSDPKSPVLDLLTEDFLNKFPNFEKNPYLINLGKKHKLLTKLLLKKKRRAVKLIMGANNLLKNKKV